MTFSQLLGEPQASFSDSHQLRDLQDQWKFLELPVGFLEMPMVPYQTSLGGPFGALEVPRGLPGLCGQFPPAVKVNPYI